MIFELRQRVGGRAGVVVQRNADIVHCREITGRVKCSYLSTDVRPQSARPDVTPTVDEVTINPRRGLVQLDSQSNDQ